MAEVLPLLSPAYRALQKHPFAGQGMPQPFQRGLFIFCYFEKIRSFTSLVVQATAAAVITVQPPRRAMSCLMVGGTEFITNQCGTNERGLAKQVR